MDERITAVVFLCLFISFFFLFQLFTTCFLSQQGDQRLLNYSVVLFVLLFYVYVVLCRLFFAAPSSVTLIWMVVCCGFRVFNQVSRISSSCCIVVMCDKLFMRVCGRTTIVYQTVFAIHFLTQISFFDQVFYRESLDNSYIGYSELISNCFLDKHKVEL